MITMMIIMIMIMIIMVTILINLAKGPLKYSASTRPTYNVQCIIYIYIQ